MILSKKLHPLCTVYAETGLAAVHSTPDSTQFAYVVCARFTLLMLPAFYNVLHQNVNNSEFESENTICITFLILVVVVRCTITVSMVSIDTFLSVITVDTTDTGFC
jgi:hypothetical protein